MNSRYSFISYYYYYSTINITMLYGDDSVTKKKKRNNKRHVQRTSRVNVHTRIDNIVINLN